MADITTSLFPEVGSLFRQQDMQAGINAANLASGGYANAALAAGLQNAAMAGSRAGRTLGGLLGATTPEQDEANATKQIADQLTQQGVDLQSGDGMMRMAQLLNQQGKYNAAQKAAAAANILREKEATIALHKAQAEKALREQKSADPIQKLLETGKYTPESVAKFKDSGNVSDLMAVAHPEAKSNIQKLQEYRKALDPVKDAALIKEVDANIESLGKGQTTNVNVELKPPQQAAELVSTMQKNVKPYTEILDSADQAIKLIGEARKGQNAQAWQQAVTSVAKLAQGGRLSNQDIARAGGDPAILATIKDYVSGKLTGLPSENTMKNLLIVANLLRRDAEEKRNGVIEDQKRIARVAKMSEEDINQIFQPSKPVATGTRKTKSGVVYSVED